MGLGYVSVPMGDGNVAGIQQILDAGELVVDQALEGGNVEHAYAAGGLLGQLGEDWEKGRFSFARRGG